MTQPPPTQPTPIQPTPTQPTPTQPVPLPAGSMLAAADRHLVSRFSYGVNRALADQVLAAGGAAAWFEAQLTQPGTADPATDPLWSWYPSLQRTPADLVSRDMAGLESETEVMQDYQRLLLIRRIRSTRPVLDVMAEFWENHFNVPVMGDNVFTHRVSYGTALRERALGRFDDLLSTAVLHPAMLIYLNGAVNTKVSPNENLGRELLELHTVGLGQFTEDDVKASARILTGFRVGSRPTFTPSYQTGDHWTGPVRVMGFTDANSSADGRATAASYLHYLAHHPSTATRVATKLAVKFVSDQPSPALVAQLAAVYLASDTAIAPVLRALVASDEFAASVGDKIRDPAEEVVATYRVLGVQVAPPGAGLSTDAETAILGQATRLGQSPHSWPRPDGAPTTNGAWATSSRMMESLDLHLSMARGYPSTGSSRPSTAEWLPSSAVRLADLVEHLSRLILHASAPSDLVDAVCIVLGASPDLVLTPSHAIVRFQFPWLLATVLDHPLHMSR